MPLNHVTMRDVARVAGVHQTTVSMALRNDPRLPQVTRDGIRRIADRMGYQPDPMLSALNFYRSSQHPVKSPPIIAFVLNLSGHEVLRSKDASVYAHQRFLEGAKKKARQIGYQIEVFFVCQKEDSRRLERILRARGIVGVILCAMSDRAIQFDWDWDAFCVTLIESQHLPLSFHMISSNHLMITRLAVQRLFALGYQRIGLAVGEHEEDYLRNAFTIGYYGEMAAHGESIHIPHFLLPNGLHATEIGPPLADWVSIHKIQVIITNWPNIAEALRLTGRRVPEETIVITLDHNPDQGPNAGMQQNHIVVGERAVEQISILMRIHQRGLVEPNNHTLINGSWVDGSDLLPLLRRKTPRSDLTKTRKKCVNH